MRAVPAQLASQRASSPRRPSGCTGQPSSAKRIAGCSSSSRPLRPCAFSSVSQAEIAPGMVTACAEVFSSAADAVLLVPVDGGGGRRPAGAVQRDDLAGRRPAHRGRSSRRRCRWIAARSRTARRRRPPRRPARCRRRAARRARSAWRPAWRSRPCRAWRRPGCGRAGGSRAYGASLRMVVAEWSGMLATAASMAVMATDHVADWSGGTMAETIALWRFRAGRHPRRHHRRRAAVPGGAQAGDQADGSISAPRSA